MRILLTGGHFSPAYSLISELKKRGHRIIIAGRRYPFEDDRVESFEYKVSKNEDLEFHEVMTGRFQRKFTAYTITSLFKTPVGLVSAIKIITRTRPDVVLTFGGYIGLPIALAASLLKIPIVLHEQTQKAGLASRIIGRLAKKICLSFESSSDFFSKNKTVLTGNPVRLEVFEPKEKIRLPEGKTIYITGGSTGSHFINSVIYEILEELLDEFIIVHQTGDSLKFRDFEKLSLKQKKLNGSLGERYILRRFIFPDEIGDVYKACDLIISRAGANIIFEIMAIRKMSLLIPLPHGQNREQLENAKFLNRLGISEFMEESSVSPEELLRLIREMFRNQSKYLKNMNKTRAFIKQNAAGKIADVVESAL